MADHGNEDSPGGGNDFGGEFLALVLEVGKAKLEKFMGGEGGLEALVKVRGEAVFSELHRGGRAVGQSAEELALGVGEGAGHNLLIVTVL
jgi:hypothetical protein